MNSVYNIDLTGKTFNKLTVLNPCEDSSLYKGYKRWVCRCKCGAEVLTTSYSLIKGFSGSCGLNGCGAWYHKTPDLSGKRFGKLLVIKMLSKRKFNQRAWECLCDCGKTITVITTRLNKGKTTHCGCSFIKYTDRSVPVKKGLYYSYKRRAKRKNINFEISFELFCMLLEKDCFYCKTPPANTRITNTEYRNPSKAIYNGIDRLNNNKGYIPDNCVTCCPICNTAKGTKTFEDFIFYIKNLKRNLCKNTRTEDYQL